MLKYALNLTYTISLILLFAVSFVCIGPADGDERENTSPEAIALPANITLDDRIGAKDISVSPDPALDDMIGMENVTVEPLARGEFPDRIAKAFSITLDGSSHTTEADVADAAEVVTAELTFEPDGFVGWHTHPGPAIVTVTSGTLTIVNELDCVERKYEEGQSFVDPGQGNVHVGYNASGEETRIYAIFFDVPPGGEPTDLLDEPGNCPA